MATSKKKSSQVVTVNLSEAVGGNVPEGAYLMEVVEAEKTESQAGNDTISWKMKVADGPHSNKLLYYNTSLLPQALWNLRGLVEALGYEIEDGDMDLDLSAFVGDQFVGVVAHETYEGKKRPRIVDLLHVDSEEGKEALEVEGEDEPEEKKPAKKSSTKGKKSEPEEEEDEKPAGKAKPTKKGKKPEPEPELIKEDDVMELDEDGLGELITEHELEVDLDDHATLRKKRNAVLAALEDKELLEPSK